MGLEKQSSRSGGSYVGGFLQFFDWNGKSRKKLFSSKSDLPEGCKQGKRSDGNLPMTRIRLLDDDDDENNWASSIRGSSDYSCASSVTDDDGCGSRSPGVVARLMGLDSMPTTNVESYSTPFFDTRSLRDAPSYRRTPNFNCDHKTIYSSGQPAKLEVSSQSCVESTSQKIQKIPKIPNRPIDRFQTETLPPKSAKSIPITHHKLLSPIKSPGFIPTKDAADIMEAASKIIKPQPQGTTRGKMPSLGSSSVPFKVRDLKEKMDAVRAPSRLPGISRKAVESNAVKHLKEQPLNKSWNGSEDSLEFKASPDSGGSNTLGSKNKGKSISLAIQAKVNVQRRESLKSSSRNLHGQKEPYEFKSSQQFKGQLNTQKNMQKRSPSHGASGVLRQNNQKQNYLTNKEKLPTKLSVPNLQGRKTVSGDGSFGRNKTLNKGTGNSRVGSKKGLETTNREREVSSSRSKNFPQKKRSIEGDCHLDQGASVRSFLVNKDEKRIEANIGKDGRLKWAEHSRSSGTDVVSFTFTSPMVKSMPGSQLSGQMAGKSNIYNEDSSGEKFSPLIKNAKLSSLGLNVVGGDALSILLEEKLRELTFGVESSRCNAVKLGSSPSSACITQDFTSALNSGSMMPRLHDWRSQLPLQKDESSFLYNSAYGKVLNIDHSKQVGEDTAVYSSRRSKIDVGKENDHRHPSPVSILDTSFSSESYNSSDSGDGYSNDVSMQCSSIQPPSMVEPYIPNKSMLVEPETELSDSASSVFTACDCRGQAIRFITVADNTRLDEQKLKYMKEILCNVDLMFKDFTLGRAREIINPHLFDQLEKTWSRADADDKDSWLRRKVLFDCARESLDLRCRRYAGGGCKTWVKGVALVQRKEWLAEEVYKEILGWESMADWMVDELVDKDMSTQYGRWLDFEIEEFELGVEIERSIFNSLVDEAIVDII